MVAVLVQELLAHRFLVRVGGHHVQHVDGLVATLGFDPVDVFLIERQDLFLGGIVGNLARRCPAFEQNAHAVQFGGDLRAVRGIQKRIVRVLIGKDFQL